jgi:hypothetical protein
LYQFSKLYAILPLSLIPKRPFLKKRYFFFLGLSAYLLTACYQPEAGCLDIEATNFAPTADEDCGKDDKNNCPCDYPIFSFDTIDYTFAKATYKTDTIYKLDGQYFRLKKIRFFLSDFQFIKSDGQRLGVEDTVSLTVLNDNGATITKVFSNDFKLVEKDKTIDMGQVRQSGQYDSLRFVVGIGGEANTTTPQLTISSHVLADETMYLGNQSDGYIFNQIIINKDTLTDVETTLNIGGAANLVEVKMPFSYKTPLGKNFSLGTLRIDHSKWFDGINFAADTDTVMIEKIVANTVSVFSFSN